MRILWHSCAPWLGTGYGTQTAIWCKYLQAQGHDVAISSYFGASGMEVEWEGITVYPPPLQGNVAALIPAYARKHKADVIIVLADVWIMDPKPLEPWTTLAWIPVDAHPLSLGDTYFLKRSNVHPVAMSEAGHRTLQDAGITAGYVPHAIDTTVWQPDPQRQALRRAYGIADSTFAIGMNFNNIDPVRKATPEQFHAFADFHTRHPDSVLYAHSITHVERSLDLRVLARTLRILDHVRFPDQDRVHTGGYTTQEMARWYCAMDVISNTTYGEGFGLPAIEAQACGTPVILSDGTTGPQLRGPGWLVPTEPWWNNTHASWWHRPSIHGIKKAYEKAFMDRSPFKRQACRLFAEKYDIQVVGPQWLAILEGIEHADQPAS